MTASTTLWVLIAGCAVLTAVIKGVGPVALGGRELPTWFGHLVAAMVPALLAAGAYGVAVVGAVSDAADPAGAVRQLLAALGVSP